MSLNRYHTCPECFAWEEYNVDRRGQLVVVRVRDCVCVVKVERSVDDPSRSRTGECVECGKACQGNAVRCTRCAHDRRLRKPGTGPKYPTFPDGAHACKGCPEMVSRFAIWCRECGIENDRVHNRARALRMRAVANPDPLLLQCAVPPEPA